MMNVFFAACGFMTFILLLAFIFVFFFMSDEDWDELNKYYEEQNNKGKQGDEYVGSQGNPIQQNSISNHWSDTF